MRRIWLRSQGWLIAALAREYLNGGACAWCFRVVRGPDFIRWRRSRLDITGFLEALAECTHTVCDRVKRCGVEKSYDRHRRLPRARREGPYGRAPDKRDEFAPFSCGHPKLGSKHCIR